MEKLEGIERGAITYKKSDVRPEVGKWDGFDHVHFYVSNAKQVAAWYCLRMGFHQVAYRGLETGSRDIVTHVVKQGKIIFAFSSPLNPSQSPEAREIMIRGDAAQDVAFRCGDVKAIYAKAIERGGESVLAPVEEKDEYGSVIRATVKTYGNVVHSFIQRNDYKGVFLPGYKAVDQKDPLADSLPAVGLAFIDHVVGNQPDNEMVPAADWYCKVLQFHRFWSVDDSVMHSKYSALRSIVVTDWDETIKMPINEPAPGKRKSQIQEFVDYHGGPGVQHIALNTPDILKAITVLRGRGLDFLRVPKEYYEDLRKRLAKSPIKISESLDEIERLAILVDFDDKGYLLQLFTKPVEDRPTLFYEVIQRHNHWGFGAGNFKALFEAIEDEQAKRGNLTIQSSSSAKGACDNGKACDAVKEPCEKKARHV
jgi:4-hydroxyphenylpyruvate dioxygenase